MNIYGSVTPPADADVNSGYRGFLGRRKKLLNRSFYHNAYGPAEDLLQALAGPYQWIKAEGNDPAAIFQTLGLPEEVVNDLVTSLGTVDGNFIKTEYSYDQTGNVKNVFSATGNTSFHRDTDGRIVEIIDAIHAKTEIEYGYLGLPVKIVKSDASKTGMGQAEMDYDSEGRVIFRCVVLDKTGGRHGDPASFVRHTYAYSPEGNLIQQTGPEGLITSYEYNARKLRKKIISEDPQTKAWRGSIFFYDHDGRITTSRYGVKHEHDKPVLVEKIDYDGLGRVQYIIDGRGTKWYQGWSYRDLLAERKDQGNQLLLVAVKSLRNEQWKYNDYGEPVSYLVNGILIEHHQRTPGGRIYFTDGTGKGAYWQTYDLLGRPAWSRDAAGTETMYTYCETPYRTGIVRLRRDENGHRIVTTNRADLNPRGLPVRETTFANGIIIEQNSGYDANGHLIASRNHLQQEKRFNRNWLDWMLSEQEDRDTSGGSFDEASYRYDKRGLARQLTDPAGYLTSWEYNAFGELIAQHSEGVAVGIITGFKYDAIGRVTETRNGDVQCKIVYDRRGDATAEQYYGSGTWITFLNRSYDDIGRITSQSHTNPSISWLGESGRKIVTDREYDEIGRLKLEKTWLDNVLHFSANSWWNEHAGGWKREILYCPALELCTF